MAAFALNLDFHKVRQMGHPIPGMSFAKQPFVASNALPASGGSPVPTTGQTWPRGKP